MAPIALGILGFAIACATAYLLTPVTSRLAHRYGILDVPDESPLGRKAHAAPVPYLGGIAICAGAVLGGSMLLFAPDDPLAGSVKRYVAVLGLSFILGIVGLLDDALSLPRSLRLIAQVGAATVAALLGFAVSATPWEALNIAITILWIVGITNAFNLLDNMDGLSAGLAGLGALAFAGMSFVAGFPIIGITAAVVAGGAFGFLAHNRHPAVAFMGDAGSLFLGFSLALIGIRLRFDNIPEVTFLVPVVVLGLPIFDTTLVVASRLARRQSPFIGGRDHVSHRLVDLGLPVRATVRLLYWVSVFLGWLGLVISRSNVEVGWMLLGLVIALGVYFGVLLWRVPGQSSTATPQLRSAEEREPQEPASA